MIFITQLVYIKEGQEKIFDEFEAVAIPLISKYNGKLLLRIRPNDESIIQINADRPYEVHLVEFPSKSDFERFMKDDTRAAFLHLKEKAIRASVLIKGGRL